MRFTNKWIWLAAALTLTAVIASFTAKPLIAQIKAALVQSIDEPGRNPYSSTILPSAIGCPGAVDCEFDFAPVPAGKRLVATNLVGNFYVVTPGIIPGGVGVFPTNGAPGSNIMAPATLQAGVFLGANMLGVSAPITAYFEPGTTPGLAVGSTTGLSPFQNSHLTLSGYLVSVP